MLERYYAVLRERGGEAFDAREAARLELDWWQLRRENAQASEYGAVIARTTSAIFTPTTRKSGAPDCCARK